MSSDRTLEALVLDVFPYRDSDLMGRFFSAEAGSFSAVAYGARKTGKRFPSGLDHQTIVELQWSKTPNRPVTIQSAQVKEVFWSIREDFDRTCATGFFCELLAKAHVDKRESQFLYPRTLEFLRIFDATPAIPYRLGAVWAMLTTLGTLRLVDLPAACSACSSPRPIKQGAFDPRSGQFVCPLHNVASLQALSAGALTLIQLTAATASFGEYWQRANPLGSGPLDESSLEVLRSIVPFLGQGFGNLKTVEYLL